MKDIKKSVNSGALFFHPFLLLDKFTMFNKNKPQTYLFSTRSQNDQKTVGNPILFALSALSIVGLTACQQSPDYNYLIGETMGTSYHISYQLPEKVIEADIQAAIDQRLQQINDSMSTYQVDSTISKFNQLGKDTPISIDTDFSHVLDISRQVYAQSGGAFDPTVIPLINTWG
ncbi:FAD:protein FMN transferase, partial [Psychrobacter sp. 1U2]|uniref:FAD:protein FMN transferase n=1 Tax=Psychrobacter sp. 1U2 TaxID=3453577 RepID=UPI003F44BB31